MSGCSPCPGSTDRGTAVCHLTGTGFTSSLNNRGTAVCHLTGTGFTSSLNNGGTAVCHLTGTGFTSSLNNELWFGLVRDEE